MSIAGCTLDCHRHGHGQVVSHLSSAASRFVALELQGSVVRVAKQRGREDIVDDVGIIMRINHI